MAVDKKISQLASGAPAQAGDEYVVARSGANFKLTLTNIAASMPPIGATTPNTGSFTSLTNSGNLTFSSTAQRITGDFSNATIANRLIFQTSTANSGSTVQVIPSGTGTTGAWEANNASDPTNSGGIRILSTTSDSRVDANIRGTGTYLPMTFYTGGSERMRLDTSGNLGIGVTPSAWGGSFKALQISNSSIYNNGGSDTFVGANFFWDGTNNKYIATDFAVAYGQQDGEHRFYTAPSGTAGNNITFTERMRIDSSGNVGIGTTSPDAKLTVSGGAASFADGTSSAPAIANAGDLDTGVYFPAANEVAVTTGGAVAAAFNSNGLFFRNRIINGDMRIAQRGTAAVTGGYPVDRIAVANSTDGLISGQQDSSAPAGFVNSVKFTTTTADATLTTTQNAQCLQSIEGTNVADLAWGTANARTVTLSFWVRSSLTGTFGGSLRNNALDRSYPFTYSISVADTWEYKTVTIPGDTSGTWLTTTGIGISVLFGLGAGPDRSGTAGAWAGANYVSATGAVSVIGTLNATWYITGVQLETGSVATPFERRPYGTELMLCQRYYYRMKPASGDAFSMAYASTTTGFVGIGSFPVTMRTSPTALEQSGTAANYAWNGTTSVACSAVPVFSSRTSEYNFLVIYTVASGLTGGHGGSAISDSADAYLGWSAEL